jgi:hypothetical protein
MTRLFSTPRCVSLALGVACTAPLSPAQENPWRISLTPYAWATDVHVDVALDGDSIVDETIPVADLLEDVEATFQGRCELHRGRFGALLDAFYVAMSDSASGFPLPQGAGTGELDWRMDLTIGDLALTFDPQGDGEGLSMLLGTRLIEQSVRADATFTTAGGSTSVDLSADDTLVDGLIGLRYGRALGQHLRFEAQLDLSTGGTEHTWSVFPALTYGFFGDRCALVAGYRHLAISFEEEGGLESDVELFGPVIGLRCSF